MNSPATDLKDLLVTAAVGTFAATSGWSLNVSLEPPAPHTTITLYDSGGSDPDPALKQDWPSVQVRVRGDVKAYANAYAKAQAVKDAILGIAATTLTAVRYTAFFLKGDINFMGYDQTNRPSFTLNFRICREPTTGARA